jgi:hypothetical protein
MVEKIPLGCLGNKSKECKKYFLDIFNFDDNKIKFGFIDSNFDIDLEPFCICQQIILFPKKYFYTITNKYFYNETHCIPDKIMKYGDSIDIFDYFVYTRHTSNTFLGWNPLFIQVGREYNNKYDKNLPACRGVEYYYDIKTHTFVHDVDKTIEFWKPFLDSDTFNKQPLPLL